MIISDQIPTGVVLFLKIKLFVFFRSPWRGSRFFTSSIWFCPCCFCWFWIWPRSSSVRAAARSLASRWRYCCPSSSFCWFLKTFYRPLKSLCRWWVGNHRFVVISASITKQKPTFLPIFLPAIYCVSVFTLVWINVLETMLISPLKDIACCVGEERQHAEVVKVKEQEADNRKGLIPAASFC